MQRKIPKDSQKFALDTGWQDFYSLVAVLAHLEPKAK